MYGGCVDDRAYPFKQWIRSEWERFFHHFADWVEEWRRDVLNVTAATEEPARLRKEMELPELAAEHFEEAFNVEAGRLLEDFTQANHAEDRNMPETKVMFGNISDGKTHGGDLTEN